MPLRSRLLALAVLLPLLLSLVFCSKGGSGGDDDTDDIAPFNITDLTVSAVSDSSVTLTWTAQGDDGDDGTAATYDIRWAKSWINWENWEDAYQIEDEPKPRASGSTESFEVKGLTKDSTYYFAIKGCDEVPHCPEHPSNCVHAACFVDDPITFADDSLEATIRTNVNKPTGQLMRSDVEALTFLDGNERGIANLEGIGQVWNLEVVFLSRNEISDLTPLSELTKLRVLQIGHNNVTNLSPLAGMDQITHLILDQNSIADLSPIADMSAIHFLWLFECGLTDLAPLAASQVLADNDTVGVMGNPLSAAAINEQIPALEARGVTVMR